MRLFTALSPQQSEVAEVTSPILATTAVLAAVCVPTTLLGGLSGQFYQHFAHTIAISTALSAVHSLTLSPALAARGPGRGDDGLRRHRGPGPCTALAGDRRAM